MSQLSHDAYSLRPMPVIELAGEIPLFLDSSPLYDLLESLRVLARPSQKGRWREWRGETITWLQSKQQDLLPEIRRWFADPFSLGMASMALIPLLQQLNSAEAFLTGLAHLPILDFLRLAIVNGPTDPETPLDAATLLSLQQSPVLARTFADRYLCFTGRQRMLLLQVLQDTESARSRLLSMLHRYYEQVYAPLEGHIQEEREQAVHRLQAELSTGSPLRARITRRFTLREFTPVIIAPSVFLERTFPRIAQRDDCRKFLLSATIL